jgi:hypothetical protein
MLLTRITNLLPKYFGINELFFIRYSSKEPEKNLRGNIKRTTPVEAYGEL